MKTRKTAEMDSNLCIYYFAHGLSSIEINPFSLGLLEHHQGFFNFTLCVRGDCPFRYCFVSQP